MSNYLQVSISAENKEQANDILNSLLEKKLVTGGQIINAPARFLWKDQITDMDYYTVTSFTLAKNKEAIINEVTHLTHCHPERSEGSNEILRPLASE